MSEPFAGDLGMDSISRACALRARGADHGNGSGAGTFRRACETSLCVSVSGCRGVPSACATTNVSADRIMPTRSSSSACRSRCAPQSSTRTGGQRQRAPLAALGRLVADLRPDLFGAFLKWQSVRWSSQRSSNAGQRFRRGASRTEQRAASGQAYG